MRVAQRGQAAWPHASTVPQNREGMWYTQGCLSRNFLCKPTTASHTARTLCQDTTYLFGSCWQHSRASFERVPVVMLHCIRANPAHDKKAKRIIPLT